PPIFARRLIHASLTVPVWLSRGQVESVPRGVTRCVRRERGAISSTGATDGRDGQEHEQRLLAVGGILFPTGRSNVHHGSDRACSQPPCLDREVSGTPLLTADASQLQHTF